MISNFSSAGFASYKDILNQRADDKFVRTTQRLAAELDILSRRDLDVELGRIFAGDVRPGSGNASQNPAETAKTLQQDYIKQSIEDILEIRRRLGIETPRGANVPLEELFKLEKGGVVDESI